MDTSSGSDTNLQKEPLTEKKKSRKEKKAARPPLPGAGPLNFLTSLAFVGAAIVFVVFFVHKYTIYNSGHWEDVAFGLWGLYYPALAAFGAARVRNRQNRSGFHHALLTLALVQAVIILLVWGSALLNHPVKNLSYAGVGAFFAGVLLAIGFLFTSRRTFFLTLAEVGGPAVLLFMIYVYPVS